jgi:hypothetical protein
MSSIFGPEIEGDDVDSRQMIYKNYRVGDFIRFKKSENVNEPKTYGIISKIIPDNAEGKSYDIIYYDTGRTDDSVTSNPVTRSILRENISLFLQDPLIQLNYHTGDPRTGVFRTVFQVKKIPDTEVSEEVSEEVPEEIREQLLAALNTDNGLNTPSASRSTTGTSYGDISRSSSSSISRNSSSGGKNYRKRKNKTRRRNKKTKRRRNRKSKRR